MQHPGSSVANLVKSLHRYSPTPWTMTRQVRLNKTARQIWHPLSKIRGGGAPPAPLLRTPMSHSSSIPDDWCSPSYVIFECESWILLRNFSLIRNADSTLLDYKLQQQRGYSAVCAASSVITCSCKSPACICAAVSWTYYEHASMVNTLSDNWFPDNQQCTKSQCMPICLLANWVKLKALWFSKRRRKIPDRYLHAGINTSHYRITLTADVFIIC